MGRAQHRRTGAILPAVVALITLLAFLPVLHAGFVTWDDNRNFLDNSSYRGLGWPQLRWMWTTFHMGHYVPLTWMTLGLDYELWGMDPSGYHLQNLLLHVANALLVYVLARRILELTHEPGDETASRRRAASAAVAALFFAVHPLRVESVAWITERRDVLSLFWCLVSVLCYIRHAAQPVQRRWYVLSLVAFVAAVLSKATAMSLPAVLLVLDAYPLRRIGGTLGIASSAARRVYLELLPFGVLSIGTAALSIVALRPPAQLGLGAKIAVAAYGLAFYLSRTIVPVGLAPLYEMPKVIDPLAARYVASYAAALLMIWLAWAMRRRHPGVTAALVAFLVLMLPLLGVIQNGPQLVADRYTYFAAPPLAMLVGGAFARWRSRSSWLRAGVVAAPIAVLAVLTWRQTDVWHDSERLWSRVLHVDSTSSIAQIAMGDVLIAQSRWDEAAEHYRRGVELDPTFAIGFNNLGVVLARQGKLDEAAEQYRRALALRPTYADAHNNWGIALSRQGDFAGAIGHFERAIVLDPRNADAETNLGNALVRQRRPEAALAHYARAASLRPSSVDAYLNWGVALADMGRLSDAIEQWRRVLAIRPDNEDARAYLARAQAMTKD